MIKRILRIDDFRIFQGWRGEPTAVDFERVNVIYGANGSGKSTLAGLLAQAGADSNWQSGLRLTVVDEQDQTTTIASSTHQLWQSIKVFNRDFVSANLQFDAGGDSTTQPLLVLGQSTIDKAERARQIDRRLPALTESIQTRRKAITSAKRAADNLAKKTADLIVSELQSVGGKYAPRSYNAARVKQLITRGALVDRSRDVALDLSIVQHPPIDQILAITRTAYDTTLLEEEIRHLLKQKVTSAVIDSLSDDAQRASWVQAGMPLHQPGNRCAFCGGVVSPERMHDLERHFDKSLLRLQESINQLDAKLVQADASLEGALRKLPEVGTLAPELQDDWSSGFEQVSQDVGSVRERLAALRRELARKPGNLFSSLDVVGQLDGQSEVDLSALVELVNKHNGLAEGAGARQREAAQRVEHVRVCAMKAEYEQFLEDEATAQAELDDLLGEEDALRSELRELAQQEMDALPLADSLNYELARLLGRDDLSFELNDAEGYAIKRGGKPALFLSEGEKTAISLLYFLKSLEAHDCKPEETIVVIDDPVSSLDSNVIAGVSAHLWARLVGRRQCKQLFLLTHNFELFRSWTNQLDRLGSTTRKLQGITDTAHELRVRTLVNPDGSVSRRPFLLPWPSESALRNRIRSEYHYLFWRTAKTLQECQEDPTPERELDAAAILPNVCRRMLEAFLSFKYPEKIGDFRALVEAAVGDMDASVTRTRLVTYLHQYSHNEEGDISRPVSRPESITMLACVFDAISNIDKDHYAKMCSSLAVNPSLATA